MTHPIRRPDVQAEIEAACGLLSTATAGKITVEFNCKDGVWTLGNILVVLPRKHLTRDHHL